MGYKALLCGHQMLRFLRKLRDIFFDRPSNNCVDVYTLRNGFLVHQAEMDSDQSVVRPSNNMRAGSNIRRICLPKDLKRLRVGLLAVGSFMEQEERGRT